MTFPVHDQYDLSRTRLLGDKTVASGEDTRDRMCEKKKSRFSFPQTAKMTIKNTPLCQTQSQYSSSPNETFSTPDGSNVIQSCWTKSHIANPVSSPLSIAAIFIRLSFLTPYYSNRSKLRVLDQKGALAGWIFCPSLSSRERLAMCLETRQQKHLNQPRLWSVDDVATRSKGIEGRSGIVRNWEIFGYRMEVSAQISSEAK